MTDTAVAGKRSAFGEAITTANARSRALLAALVLAAIFAIGLLSGLAVSPALRSASQPVAVSAGAMSQVAAQAHLAWLRSEHDSYGSSTSSPAAAAQAHLAWLRSEHDSYGSSTSSPTAAAQAHLAWLRSEHDSYGSSTTSPTSSLQSWIKYRQFRLSEEGYGQ